MTEREDNRSGMGERLGAALCIGIFTLMVFSTLAFGTVDPWSIGLFGIIVVLLLLLWGIKSVVDRKLVIKLPAATLPIGLLIGYGALQGVAITDDAGRRWSISMDVEATRMALEVAICLLIAFLLAAYAFRIRERLIWLKNFLIFFGLALAVFGLIHHFSWNGKFYWLIEVGPLSSPFGPFVSHNHFAGYLEMIVPIPLALIITRAVRSELTAIYGFAAVIMSVATVVSLSRGGTISLIAGVMFVVIFGLRPSMMRSEPGSLMRFPLFLSRIGAAVVLVVAIGLGVLWVGADSVIRRVERTEISNEEKGSEPGKETFYQSRGWIWRDTLAMIRNNWIAGVGMGAYQTVYPMYSERDGRLIVSQSHNDYLQVLADFGVIGAIAALAFIVLIFRDMFRSFRHRDPFMSAFALGCAGGIFAMLVHSLFDFNLQLPSNALLFLVLTAAVSVISRSAVRGRVNQDVLAHGSGRRLDVRPREMEVWS